MATIKETECPQCGFRIKTYANPVPTVDIIIRMGERIVLIERKNPPFGWALPGGFVDYGESFEEAAVREALEETGIEVRLVWLLGVYSGPDRDPRQHTVSAVYVADNINGVEPVAGDDAARAIVVDPVSFEGELAFDHKVIIEDYVRQRERKCPAGKLVGTRGFEPPAP